ncbi:MAG: phosphoenolpyruvate--protein phosphotransferase [Lachnospiraceae bacterium]|nr:phosphoenolpyruvate--protein phosphotransferase [Lachnospiraceae bacterium]
MLRYQGSRVFGGYAIAPALVLQRAVKEASRAHIDDAEAECARFRAAREKAAKELADLRERTLKEMDDELARIFDVHHSMLFDADFEESVLDIIHAERVNAEYAVLVTGERYADEFASMDNAYMQARAADIADISNRVIRILRGETETHLLETTSPVILVAKDLTPSEIVRLDTAHVLAIVTRYGSLNSHAAILAGSKGIPMVIGVDYDDDIDGKTCIVDAYGALLIVGPDDATLGEYKEKKEKDEENTSLLLALKGKDNITKDGHRIDIFCNIGGEKDVADAIKNDAGGIGLFRSEYLYLRSADYPSEEEQFQAYKTVAQRMEGKKVVIRTLDIGADKRVDYFSLRPEHNPALGYRAVRICLDRPEILKVQLRAILRASAFGNIDVMYPMITSIWEVQQLKNIFEDVKSDLSDEHIAFSDKVAQGVMIETPAAVLISELLAQEVDFFSIGTNDLTQYLLASDRQNPMLERFFDPHHPAVLKAIRMVTENAHRYRKRVGICGELAADTLLTEYFLSLHVDELSVTPSRVLAVRDAVRKTDLSK